MTPIGTGSGGYEAIEHTADVGLRVWGGSLRELFEQAAAGFIDLMFAPGTVGPRQGREIRAEGGDDEELLVAWLEEILYAFEGEGFAPASVSVGSLEEGRAEGELRGEPFDPERHEVREVVKAVTYHDLRIRKADGRFEVTVIFDV